MQTYEQFKTMILDRFRSAFAGADVHISRVTKNNNTVLDGLVVMMPGSNISPTVYLNQIYEIYRESGDFDSVWRDLYAFYNEYREPRQVDLKVFSDFEKVKPCLFCRLISAVRNGELLQTVPHRMFLDLAIVYYIGIVPNGRSGVSILITNQQLAEWGKSENDLQKIALENNRRQFPAELISLSRFLSDESPYFSDDEDPLPLYILTNSAKYYGASAMLDEDMLQEFSEQAGDFYILPSSLHEVLLIAKDSAPAPEALNEIIRDVNSSHLDPTDILSDHLYTYSADSRSIL